MALWFRKAHHNSALHADCMGDLDDAFAHGMYITKGHQNHVH